MSNESVVRRFVAAWYGDGELDALVTQGYIHHTPMGDIDLAAFRAQLAAITGAFDDVAHEIVHLVAEGALVAVLVRVEMTHRESGARVHTNGAAFCRVEEGRIAEDWDAWALQAIQRQVSSASGS